MRDIWEQWQLAVDSNSHTSAQRLLAFLPWRLSLFPELLRLAEHFRSHPAARVANLLLELGYCEVGSVDIQQGAAPPFTRASDVFRQIIETLPVLGVDIGSGRTRRKPENCMIIISLLHKEAAHVLSAVMASSAERFQVSGTRN